MCFGGQQSAPTPPPIPPPLPMPPTPAAPPPPRTSNQTPEALTNPNENIGIKTAQSKKDREGTTTSGTNQLKIAMNLGTTTKGSGLNIG